MNSLFVTDCEVNPIKIAHSPLAQHLLKVVVAIGRGREDGNDNHVVNHMLKAISEFSHILQCNPEIVPYSHTNIPVIKINTRFEETGDRKRLVMDNFDFPLWMKLQVTHQDQHYDKTMTEPVPWYHSCNDPLDRVSVVEIDC